MHRARKAGPATILAFAALFIASCSRQQAEAPAEPVEAPASTATAFEGARLIMGDGSMIENGVLVMDGGTIIGAGAAGDVDVPAGATTVSVAGKTIMPAFYDTHVHLSRDRAGVITDMKERAYFGVAAAMSLGRDSDDLIATRSELVPGGARYFSAGTGITRPEPGGNEDSIWIESVEEGRQAVRHLADIKVDIVKIWVDDRNGRYEKLTPEMYGAIIDEAHSLGLRVIAHIYNEEDGIGLVKAGVDAFAHGVRDRDMADSTVELYASDPDLIVGPNLTGRGVVEDIAWLQPILPEDTFSELQAENIDDPAQQERYGIQSRNLKRVYDAGVAIILGTDGNTPWEPHYEVADMIDSGMAPMDAIVAATRLSAEFLGLNAGMLAAGKDADFIVLDADPLDDIANTRKISAVYLRGEMIDRSAYP